MSLILHAEVSGPKEKSEDDCDFHIQDIVIVHGLFGSLSNWRSISKSLSQQYRIHSLDLRNHGASPWSDEMSYIDMAGDLEHYIRTNELVAPHILGHSMGGKVCMALLQNFDIEIGLAFIADIAPVSYGHDHDHLIDALKSLNLEGIHSRQEADKKLAQSIDSQPIRQFLLQNLKRGQSGFEWRINLGAISASKDQIFGYPDGHQVDTNIIFIKGENSDYIEDKYHDLILKQFPRADFDTIQNAGHWLHAEQPAALVNILKNYLEHS
jgi:esterase